MQPARPINLQSERITLEPMRPDHAAALEACASDGQLWTIRVTSVPAPGEMAAYIDTALKGQQAGHMLPFVVREAATGRIVGSTRYHDIVPAIDRLEIGYTWYARSWQRTHVNTGAKLLLMTHAFEALGARLVGWRTDNFNFASQRAIERLGARKDGVLRHHAPRRDGTVRDTVMYSLAAGEWPEVKAHLQYQLGRHGAGAIAPAPAPLTRVPPSPAPFAPTRSG